VRAAEHSGKTDAKDRQQREDDFRAGSLSALFCTPTMELGIASIDRFTREDRSISTLTVTLSKASFEIVRDRLRHLRRDILEISRGDDQSDRVVQINFQAFPLAIRPEGTTS